MPYIDIRIEVKAEIEEFGDDHYTNYSLAGLKLQGTDLPEGAQSSLAESLGQSDLYHVGFSSAALRIIDGEKEVKVEEFRY